MVDKAREYAKALVAILVPIVSQIVTQVLLDLSNNASTYIAIGAAAIAVWLTPNKAKADGGGDGE
jgi:hypothetical protein